MAFTGVNDIDFQILNQLSDYEIGKVCQVNKYAEKLCKNEFFWLNRIVKNIQNSIDRNFEIYSKYVKGLNRNIDTSGYIMNAKNFYGFKSNFDFYKFLKHLTEKFPSLYFYIFLYSKGQTKLINILYTIDKNNLPAWINYDEFIFHLRKKILEESLKAAIDRTITAGIPAIFDTVVSGFKRNNNRFLIPDYKFIIELLGDIKRSSSGLPVF